MLKIYNTLSRKKEIFRPKKNKKVQMFVCGPTVYDFSHLGHARTYINFDLISNYLRYLGYKVFYLQNITDIDDKIIQRAKKEKKSFKEIAKKFEKEYFKDMKSLKIDGVTKYAKATDYIKEIQNQVKKLLEKDYAYKLKDGIYYDITKFKNYGKLSRRKILKDEDAISRIDENKNKRNKGDFCLWKLSKKDEPKWESPWGGPGRPGWHIEDTAISESFFGPQYDIHGGARDLIFPHHEAEISQMEAISGKSPMVKYWLHTGFLTVFGQKMAKSLGNFITIQEFLKKNSLEVLRLFILSSHYRSPIDYNEKAIKQTKENLERINTFFEKVKSRISANLPISEVELLKEVQLLFDEFKRAIEDDFNTPKALSVIFSLIKKVNPKIDTFSKEELTGIHQFFKEVDKIFKILIFPKKEKIPKDILGLVEKREKYRKEKDWKKADQIRLKIEKMGYKIEDTQRGHKIKII